MLIVCDGCNSKVRVPDSAAGKRVKCPKCLTVIRVPAAETPAEDAKPEPEPTNVSATPMAPPPPPEEEPQEIAPLPQEEEPQEIAPVSEDVPADPLSFSTTPISPSEKAPKSKSDPDESPRKHRGRDEEDDEDDRPRGKKKRDDDDDEGDRVRRKSKSRDDDDDDDDGPPRRRRKRDDDDDDDDDDLDVRKRPRKTGKPHASSMSTTSMAIGLVSVVFGVPGCLPCCWGLFSSIALITGIIAVVLGIMSKAPGSDGNSLTGIICGAAGIAMSLIGIVWLILVLSLDGGAGGFNRGFNHGFNQGFNRARR